VRVDITIDKTSVPKSTPRINSVYGAKADKTPVAFVPIPDTKSVGNENIYFLKIYSFDRAV